MKNRAGHLEGLRHALRLMRNEKRAWKKAAPLATSRHLKTYLEGATFTIERACYLIERDIGWVEENKLAEHEKIDRWLTRRARDARNRKKLRSR